MAAGNPPGVAHTVLYGAKFFIENEMLYDVNRFAESINRDDYFISDTYVGERESEDGRRGRLAAAGLLGAESDQDR